MVNSNEKPIGERVAILETEWAQIQTDIAAIKGKLDDLLQLKSQGIGALWLVGIIISSGVLGLIALVGSWFNHPHV